MNHIYIKTILKLLLRRKKQLFLTITGMILPLLLYIALWESMNSLSSSAYRHLQSLDPNGVIIRAESAIDLTDLVHTLNQEDIPYTLTTQYTTDFHLSRQMLCADKPVQLNLNTVLLSGTVQEGFLTYNAMDTIYENKIVPLYVCSSPGQDTHTDHTEKTDSPSVSAVPCILEKSTSLLLFRKENSAGMFFSFPAGSKDLVFRVCAVIEDLPETLERNLAFNRDLLFSGTEDPVYISGSLYIPSRFASILPQDSIRNNPSFCCIQFPEDSFEKGYSTLLKADLHAGSCSLTRYADILEQTRDQFMTIRLLILPFFVFMMLIAGLMIMNTTFFSISERTAEIGIRRAAGAGTKKIILQFLFEGSITGIVSAALACILSGLMLRILSFCMLRIIGRDLVFSLHAGTVLSVFAFSVTLTLLFSFLPAQSGARTDPSVLFLN